MDKPMIAYVAGPYRADTPEGQHLHINNARRLAEILWQLGYAVICPHLNSCYMDEIVDNEVFMQGYLRLVEVADVLFMLPDWRKSDGARREFAHAGRHRKHRLTLKSIEEAKDFPPEHFRGRDPRESYPLD